MKKLFFFIILIFSACQKEMELTYSCNKEVDIWVKRNFQKIQTMSRKQWLEMNDYETQKASYSAFFSDKKINFWIQKLNEVLTLKWSQKEKDHISQLIDFLHKRPDFFEIEYLKNEMNLNDCSIFEYKWHEYAINELGWNNKIVYGILGTGEKMITKEGAILSRRISSEASMSLTKSETGGGYSKTCTCSTYQDFCDLTGEFQQACRNNVGLECNVNPKNCGWWWNKDCDGNCRHAWVD